MKHCTEENIKNIQNLLLLIEGNTTMLRAGRLNEDTHLSISSRELERMHKAVELIQYYADTASTLLSQMIEECNSMEVNNKNK